MTETIHTELLVAPNGDVYARVMMGRRPLRERLVRRRSRSRQEAIDEGWEVAHELFEQEAESRQQMPLFGPRIAWRRTAPEE